MPEQGFISTYREDRGFGFIRSESREKELFFHVSACDLGEDPAEGMLVEFEAEQGDKGPRATRVWNLTGQPDAWLLCVWARLRGISGNPGQRAQHQSLGRRVLEFEKLVAWHGTSHPDTKEARRALENQPLVTEDVVQQCIKYGEQQGTDFAAYEKLIARKGSDHDDVKKERSRLSKVFPHLRYTIEKKTQNATALQTRVSASSSR